MKQILIGLFLIALVSLNAIFIDVEKNSSVYELESSEIDKALDFSKINDGNDDPLNATLLTLPVEENPFDFRDDSDYDWYKIPALGIGDTLIIIVAEDDPEETEISGYLFGPVPDPYSIDIENSVWDIHQPYFHIPESGDYYLVLLPNVPQGHPLKHNFAKDNVNNSNKDPWGTYLLSVSCNYNNQYNPPINFVSSINNGFIELTWEEPEGDRYPIGYKVYRNQMVISSEMLAVGTNSYIDDNDLAYGSEYEYYVVAVYDNPYGFSLPSNIETVVYINIGTPSWGDDFEEHPDFALDIPNWIQYDLDAENTCIINNVQYEHAGEPTSFMVFNPSATTPPCYDLIPQSGDKFLVSLATTSEISNDWLITPAISLGTNTLASFYAKDYSVDANPTSSARFTVNMSFGGSQVSDFIYNLHPNADYFQAPAEWTLYQINISELSGYTIRLGIQAVNPINCTLLIDNFRIDSSDGIVDIQETEDVAQINIINQNYPNPFNPETTISYNLAKADIVRLDIYNIKGQKVKTLLNAYQDAGQHKLIWNGKDEENNNVASGIYLYKIQSGSYSSSKKMILLK